MYDYIKGSLVELTPTELVLDCNDIGFKILISLQTYSKLKQGEIVKLYIHHHTREDLEQFFGFFDKDERFIFRNLIEVSGIGPNSARMMLSSLTSDEVREAIITGDINKLKSVKGVGLKTAQRLLIDLKDKIAKGSSSDTFSSIYTSVNTGHKEEATSALILLGFTKANVEKVLDSLLRENPAYTLEELIKLSFKRL